MGYKKHNWKRFGDSETIFEIRIREDFGKDIDFFRGNNNREFTKILKILSQKYNITPDSDFIEVIADIHKIKLTIIKDD